MFTMCDVCTTTKCIEMISESLKISTAEVKRKLHNLRCQVNGELRKIMNKESGIGAHDVKRFRKFFDALKFTIGISECVKTVKTQSVLCVFSLLKEIYSANVHEP